MSWQIFISYARGTSRGHAEALQQALGSDVAFLDTSGIQVGERFPSTLVDALLGSRLFVAFVDEAYFTRWYCLWELRTALAPFLALPSNASEADKTLALAHIVLALPPEAGAPAALDRLPPGLRTTHWPKAAETEQLCQWIRSCLAGGLLPLGKRLEQMGQLEQVRARLLQEPVLPPPLSLAGLRLHPLELPPSLGSSFVGREDDLWRIDFALTTSRPGEGTAAALSGALEAGGGFGKTRLALEYLHRLGPLRFRGGLFWVDADVSPERLEEQLHAILQTIRPDTPPLREFRQQQLQVARELAQALHVLCAQEPVLYVVDNVPEPAPGQGPKPLKTWCPALGKVALLVTSRARLSLGTEGVQPLPVPTLAPAAAVALLTEQVERSSLGSADWEFIAEWVGHLPLALELLNRAMRAGSLAPAELLEKARSVGPTLELDQQMEVLRAHIPEGQLRGVTEALLISYERLTPEAQNAARFLAQLSPAPIPLALIEAMAPLFTPQVRSLLTQRSFVTGATGGDVSSFGSMHRVLADFLRSRSPEPVMEMEEVGEMLAKLLSPKHSDSPKVWPLLDALAPHAEWLFERLKASDKYDIRVILGSNLGHFWERRGFVELAARMQQAATEQGRSHFGEEDRVTLAAKSNLGNTLRLRGDLHGSLRVLEEAFEAHLRVYGENHAETISVMNNLSLVLAELGDPRARSLSERVLKTRLRTLGEENPLTALAMANLATILRDQGDLEGTKALQERALAIRRRILGEEHPETLYNKATLASTLRMRGDPRTARTIQEELVETYVRVMGREHPDTLTTITNFAVTLTALSEFTTARKIFQDAIEISNRIFGSEHPHTLTAQTNLASILAKQGDVAGAHAIYEKVLSARRQKLGESHPDTIDSWKDLFRLFWEQKDYQRVKEVQERGLCILEEALGIRSPATIIMAWRLFLAHDYLDDLTAAQSALDKYLLWLLNQAPESLDPEAQQVREDLERMLGNPATPYRRR